VDSGEPGQRQGTDKQAEVTQGDVVEVAKKQQVADNAGKPERDDVTADARRKCDQEASDDLDDADGKHRLVCRAGDDPID